jgi:hypothetical protein
VGVSGTVGGVVAKWSPRGGGSGFGKKGCWAADEGSKAECWPVGRGVARQKGKREEGESDESGNGWPVYTERDVHTKLFGAFPMAEENGTEVSEDVARTRAEAVLEELAAGDGLRVEELSGEAGSVSILIACIHIWTSLGVACPLVLCSIHRRGRKGWVVSCTWGAVGCTRV